MRQQSFESTRYRIGGHFWQVDFEHADNLALPRYDARLATLTEAPEGSRPLLRIARAPTESDLAWPLPLGHDEQVDCTRGPKARIYLSDGLLCLGDSREVAEVRIGDPPGNLFKGVVGAGILYRLAQSGVLSLHASAVVGKSGAILVLGTSGLGKSTLSAAWMHIGQVVSDDHVLVSLDVTEAFGAWVEPFRADLYLHHDGIRLIPDAARAYVEDSGSKACLPRAQTRELFCECAPVIALMMLEPEGRGIASVVRPLSQAEVLLAIISANAYLSAGPRLAPPPLWAAAYTLASRLPALRLTVGSDLLMHPESAVRSLHTLIDDNLCRIQSSNSL